MPQSRMVSATRPTSCADAGLALGGVRSGRGDICEATMLVAVMDQSTGTSTSFCSKMVLPLGVGDGGGAALPLDLVVGRDAGAGELAREAEAGGGSGFGGGGSGCGGGVRLWGCLRGLGHLGAPPESSNGMFRRPLPVRPRLHGGAWAGRGASGGGCEFLSANFGAERAGLEGSLPGPYVRRRWQSTAAYRFKSSENHNI